jgi:hypothetical protein
MRAKEFVAEASGYIPKNDKEAQDPRWSNSMTVDVHPGEDKRQAAKMGWKYGEDSRPQKLRTDGKVNEAMMDVAVQGRMPVSAGARGLMVSRADYGSVIHDNTNILKGAADELASQLESEPNPNVDDLILRLVQRFQVKDTNLKKAFHAEYGMHPGEYAKKARYNANNSPMKI